MCMCVFALPGGPADRLANLPHSQDGFQDVTCAADSPPTSVVCCTLFVKGEATDRIHRADLSNRIFVGLENEMS